MASALRSGGSGQRRSDETHASGDGSAVSADRLFELLGDETTRRVLETIADEAMSGKEIADAVSVSRPTVYRRLTRLEEAGLVETTMVLCSDGHHHKQYRAVLERASFRIDPGGLRASVRTAEGNADRGITPEALAGNDAAEG